MEYIILMPIIAVIVGWWRSTPSIEPPEGANGVDDTNTGYAFCTDCAQLSLFGDDSHLSHNHNDNTGLGIDGDLGPDTGTSWSVFDDDGLGGFGEIGISDNDITHDLIFNAAYSNLDGNIFHHEDIHVDTTQIELFNN
jgi:hypothetical protein